MSMDTSVSCYTTCMMSCICNGRQLAWAGWRQYVVNPHTPSLKSASSR